jgi:hypothetical protein
MCILWVSVRSAVFPCPGRRYAKRLCVLKHSSRRVEQKGWGDEGNKGWHPSAASATQEATSRPRMARHVTKETRYAEHDDKSRMSEEGGKGMKRALSPQAAGQR